MLVRRKRTMRFMEGSGSRWAEGGRAANGASHSSDAALRCKALIGCGHHAALRALTG